MYIEIFKLAHVGYLILGFLVALFSTSSKFSLDKNEKAGKILWIIGSVLTGWAGGVLAYFVMERVLAIIISFIMITLGTAFITLITGNVIRKKIEKKR